jgi:hypothetical protein
MSTTRAAAAALFSDDTDAMPEEPDTAAGKRHLQARVRAEDQAAWCLITRQPHESWLSASRDLREAFLNLATRRR